MKANDVHMVSQFPLVGLFAPILKSPVLFAINICIVRPDNHQITGFMPNSQKSNCEETVQLKISLMIDQACGLEEETSSVNPRRMADLRPSSFFFFLKQRVFHI